MAKDHNVQRIDVSKTKVDTKSNNDTYETYTDKNFPANVAILR
jgi:hypothetical protein